MPVTKLKIHAAMGAGGFLLVRAHVLVLAGVLHSSAARGLISVLGVWISAESGPCVPAQVHMSNRGLGLSVFNRCPGGLFSPLTRTRR